MLDLNAWLGKSQTKTATLNLEHAKLLAVTLDVDASSFEEGDALPACWQWAWFNDALPQSELGRDGHPKKGGFLPPIELPRRMWAGGNMEIKSPLTIGNKITKKTTIKNIVEKSGKSGKLCILTLSHDFYDQDTLCISEEQNLVYREDPKSDAPQAQLITPPNEASIEESVIPHPVLMFRYSALTFNGHRIHYDIDYAREVEGYPDIVFHAPLTATKLYELGRKLAQGNKIIRFEYRATAPLFANEPFLIKGKQQDNTMILWAETPSGGLAMEAKAYA